MIEYKLTVYVYPLYLNWTLDGLVSLFERYGVNLHSMKIHMPMRHFRRAMAHEVECIIALNDERLLPYIERRLQKEIGILK